MFIAIVFVPLICYWTIVGETEMGGGTYMLPSIIVPFYTVIFSLFVIICLNFLLRRLMGISGLSQRELLTIYVLLSSACALSSITMMGSLVESVGYASWFATPENEWNDLFMRYLPDWLTIQDKDVLQGYYEGESTLYTLEHTKGWLVPAVSWSAFVLVLVFVMLCINVIVRKQWSEKERLSYPITQLPLGITNVENNFFASKLMWIGFAIAFAVTIMNGLRFLYPAVPSIAVHRRTIAYIFTEKPLNAIGIGGFNLAFYPFALGLSFLMPLDLTFSCWFFYLIGKMELVVSSTAGWLSFPGFPYNQERAFGAIVSLIIFMLWVGRHHSKAVFLGIFSRSGAEDSSEAMPYRIAVLGIGGGSLFLILFATRMGFSVWIAIVFFIIYFILSIMVTRLRAELGFYTHPMKRIMATDILLNFTGTRRLGNENLTAIALFHWFNWDFSSHPMPHQLEGLRLAEKTGIGGRRLALGIIFITAFGALSYFWVHLHIFYKVGALTGGGWARGGGADTFAPLQNWMSYPGETNFTSILFMGIGFAFSAFLSLMRFRFIWWVLHPMGYIGANLEWVMRNFWSCMLIASTAKWLVLKYSGSKGYRKAVKISVGLILGDFVAGSIWNLIGVIFNTPTYSFWPGSYLP